VLIAAEREKRPVSELLASLSADLSETEFLLSSISVMELEHGWHRANTAEAAAKRRRYLGEVLAILPVDPFTREMGVLAAEIAAEMKKTGLVIATADLLIGITALHLDCAIRRNRNSQNPPLQNGSTAPRCPSLCRVKFRL
jgi:predicted nucleic acid-binding protein